MNKDTRVSVLIDGAYLQKILKKNAVIIDDMSIHAIVEKSLMKTEVLHKVLYYDCRPYKFNEEEILNTGYDDLYLEKNNKLLDALARQEQYAVRLGTLKYLGKNDKGYPLFVQKGVDIRIALDIARIIMVGKIDKIIMITGDTDLIPAMKMARIHDIQVVIINIEYLSDEIYAYADFIRPLDIQKLIKKRVLKEVPKKTRLSIDIGKKQLRTSSTPSVDPQTSIGRRSARRIKPKLKK